jgi:putative glutamine amidotransferase
MIVFVSMRIVENATYPETRDAISHDWSRLFGHYGIVPILVPNALADPAALVAAVPGKGLLLTGGESLGPLSGEPGEPSMRDRAEMELLRAALDRGLPVLGVCRGLQVINAFFGGKVSRRLTAPHVAIDHPVKIGMPVAGLREGTTLTVNSYHDQGVAESDLAPPLRAFATSEDGCVEGLLHPELPVTAVQWHPERANPAQATDRAIIESWLSQCG